MDISNLLEKYKTNKPILCPDCGKKCINKKSCLITQVMDNINIERIGTKWKPVSYVTVRKKLKGKTEYQVSTCISNCKDYKNRNGSFGKYFWGSLKNTLQENK